jgi:predicted nucleotide-binding protein (sugar kinase/HSP70/actin superfamily)
VLRVGIPRALLYYEYGEGWLAYLDELGVEAAVSPATTGRTISLGADHADNETCLPVKVFAGHLLSLTDEADAVLVPRVISQQHGMKSCPKYLGLPDVAQALSMGSRILAPAMDLASRRGQWRRDWLDLADELGADRTTAASALRRMLGAFDKGAPVLAPAAGVPSIGIAGHVYNLRDARVSLDLLDRMRAMGVEPVTVDQVRRPDIKRQLKPLRRRIRWDFESRMVGAVLHWSRCGSVDGIIHVNSFACGPGSMIGALIEDEMSRREGVPFISITLDEHSGETGMLTRVEAFLDMLKRGRVLNPGSGTSQGRPGAQ